jgi:hypothetical protein
MIQYRAQSWGDRLRGHDQCSLWSTRIEFYVVSVGSFLACKYVKPPFSSDVSKCKTFYIFWEKNTQPSRHKVCLTSPPNKNRLQSLKRSLFDPPTGRCLAREPRRSAINSVSYPDTPSNHTGASASVKIRKLERKELRLLTMGVS